MDTRVGDGVRERSRRPVRNKQCSRRAYGEDKRPPKRLFTPEIKRFLKDWLVRRRENPYPNRDEKKTLAVQTGLTYIQVCNWFANWRRKLKNAGKEPQRRTWGDLIKSYNDQVQGNVEHFSICSEDSIWEEPEDSSTIHDSPTFEDYSKTEPFAFPPDRKKQPGHSYTTSSKSFNVNISNNNNNDSQNQCYFISSTTEPESELNPFIQAAANKYKNHIMEKYLRDCQKPEYTAKEEVEEEGSGMSPEVISKWIESAANFTPSENTYLHWTFTKNLKKKKAAPPPLQTNSAYQLHGKKELDAAEALTTLANSRSFK